MSSEFTVCFDDEQVGSQLSWDVSDGHYHKNGKHNGSIYWVQGDQWQLVVKGTGKWAEQGFVIRQAALFASPIATDGASPFPFGSSDKAVVSDTAVIVLTDNDFDSKEEKGAFKRTLRNPLKVLADRGRWELTVVLTVASLDAMPQVRVFSLDPEMQFGDGT
jgi:hypothetical protein